MSEQAIAHLTKADKVLARLIKKIGPCDWKPDKQFTLDDDADFDNNGVSHKFFLWIVPQRNEK